MDPKVMDDFIESCFYLGKELLDKENLTKKEETFLKNLDLVSEQIEQKTGA